MNRKRPRPGVAYPPLHWFQFTVSFCVKKKRENEIVKVISLLEYPQCVYTEWSKNLNIYICGAAFETTYRHQFKDGPQKYYNNAKEAILKHSSQPSSWCLPLISYFLWTVFFVSGIPKSDCFPMH